MSKYLQIFKISFQQEFVYKLNFIMWRVRNVFSIFLVFFLWDSVFSDPTKVVFGYDRARILTYVFGLIVIRSVVLSTRSIDVAGEISRGDVSNLLLKPVSYFKYWFTRDFSSKFLNLLFAIFEAAFLYYLLRPSFFFQKDLLTLGLFLLSLGSAVILYFLLVFLFSMPPFWYPQQAWGFIFLLIVLADLLGGGVFPIDILPDKIQNVIYLTPFPHLLFTPLGIYLGKFNLSATFRFLTTSFFWIGILIYINKKIWHLGLKSYRSEGR